ncbi:MAG: ABC transporter substrate-binding protein, partial [Alphaproteobacteria bacterium]|nr:ABC transporter substrate-binding protein [Alphaproteobacteria bacterium]
VYVDRPNLMCRLKPNLRGTSDGTTSEPGSRDLPAGEELRILRGHEDNLPPELCTQPVTLPVTDGSGRLREQLRDALDLLAQAGWQVRDIGGETRLVNGDGEPVGFEVLIMQSDFERLVLPFTPNLERLGIRASVRLVDVSQYIRRRDEYDFDMIVGSWGQSESPGNEQLEFWGSEAAATPASRNLAGVSDPVIDDLIQRVISASDRESLVQATRALDRVLLWGWYVIPQWYVPNTRLLWWNRFSRPALTPEDGPVTAFWWYDAEKDAALAAAGFERP